MKATLRWWGGLLVAFTLVFVMRFFLPLPFVNEVLEGFKTRDGIMTRTVMNLFDGKLPR